MKHAILGPLAGALLGLGTGAAAAQEVTLRVADSLPVGHYIAESLLIPFIAEVEERTGGAVGFDYFPAQQLGKAKDMLSLTQTGVTDIGYVGASYLSDKLPLSAVAQLPGSFGSSCEGTMAYWQLARPGGLLDREEYAPEGVRALMVLALAPYQLFSTREIHDLGSFEGQKIRASGGSQALAMTKLGGVPVQMSAPETREALSRGTLDAIVFPHSSVPPYDLTPLLDTATEGLNLGSFVLAYMISQDTFDSLSPETRTALTEAGEAATRRACALVDRQDSSDKAAIAEGGVTFVALPEADVARIGEILAGVGAEWAAELDARGRPGSEVLAAFTGALD